MAKKIKKEKEKEKENPVLKVYLSETYVHFTSRGPISISAETHPELEGMTLEEMKEYVTENAREMASVDSEYCENLIEELRESEIIKEKFLDEEENVFFND